MKNSKVTLNQNTFAEKAISFYLSSTHPENLPQDISAMNPYENEEVKDAVKIFYKRYFNDSNKRIFIWGINPGRFGGGLTGIAFTDPNSLREKCGVDTNIKAARELSSKFIYEMIDAFGGVDKFYSRYFLTALYPLALIKEDKNYNFYDDNKLFISLKDEIILSMKSQINFGAERKFTVCLGRKNYIYLKKINDEYNFFEHIEVVDHPRYIMQYKSKSKESYINKYLAAINYL